MLFRSRRAYEVGGERREEETEGMGGRKGREGVREGEKANGGKRGISGEELERGADPGEEGRGGNRKQHGRSYQPCAVGKNEFASDGLERGGSGEAVETENLLEKWRKDREAIKRVRKRKEGGRGGRKKMFERGGADPVGKEKRKEEWEICGGAASGNK